MKAARYCVIDTETTGLRPGMCHVWDVAVVIVDPNDGRICDTFHLRMNPPGGLPADLVKRFGWDPQMVEGRPPSDDPASWEPLWSFLRQSVGPDSALVAHNLPFDMSFLSEAGFVASKFGLSFMFDTLALARKFTFPGQPNNLTSIASIFNVTLDKSAAHGAQADAMTLALALPGILEAAARHTAPRGWLPLCPSCDGRHALTVDGSGVRCDAQQVQQQPTAEAVTNREVAIMVNKVTLVGNLGADPEIRTSNNGTQIGSLRVATSHRQKDADGNYADATEWHRVTVFGKDAENAGKYLAKGRQVYIEGRIQTRKYQDKDGNERYATEIIANEVKFMSGGRDEAGASGGGARDHGGSRPAPGSSRPAPASRVPDDDIPF